MAITIIKKGLGKLVLKKTVSAPAPVAQRLNTSPAADQEPAVVKKPKFNPDGWKSWPQSPTLEHFYQNRATHRPAEPRPCKLCGNSYPYPCDGAEDSKCVTAIAIREGKHTPVRQRA